MTAERKPGRKTTKASQERASRPTPERERRIQFSEVTIAAWTGEISGQHLYNPTSGYASGSTSGMHSLDRAVADIADGGYVIDLRPLADHPQITTWVFRAPMSNGRIEGEEINRLSDDVRKAAGDMASGLGGAFQDVALLAAARIGEPVDGSAGAFDYVSAAYRAVYWGSRGALIGKRVGDTLHWSDGRQQPIEAKPQTQGATLPATSKPPRRGK